MERYIDIVERILDRDDVVDAPGTANNLQT